MIIYICFKRDRYSIIIKLDNAIIANSSLNKQYKLEQPTTYNSLCLHFVKFTACKMVIDLSDIVIR